MRVGHDAGTAGAVQLSHDAPRPSDPFEGEPELSAEVGALWPEGLTSPPTAEEDLIGRLLGEAHLATDRDVPGLLNDYARGLGARDVVVYAADLQQRVLVPLRDPAQPPLTPRSSQADGPDAGTLSIDTTLPGRCFQLVDVLVQDLGHGPAVRVWLPLLDGAERIGVLGVTLSNRAALELNGGALRSRLLRLASLTAELIMTKTMYGDWLVRLRRSRQMSLAAELQWSILPPMTFASRTLTVAAGLEPAYHVAGDTFDYAVDRDVVRLALFDGMGHGLESAQVATLTVAAYRHARRRNRTLEETVTAIDDAVRVSFPAAFVTGQVAELDTSAGVLRWINAGHPDPLLVRAGRLVRPLKATPRPPLGFGDLSRGPTQVGREHLEPGDIVVLYSDGVIEARAPDGTFFGLERLADLVVRNVAARLPAPETTRRIIRALLDHQQDRLADDASILVLHYRPLDPEALLP